jgi:medium-chain acyl-[acyl-carrier-protein] hydrolase
MTASGFGTESQAFWFERLSAGKELEAFMDVLRTDSEVVETYKYSPGEPLCCPITVYGGLQDEDVSLESCEVWRRAAAKLCRLQSKDVPRDHSFIRDPPGGYP